MATELEKLLGDEKETPSHSVEEPPKKEPPEEKPQDPEVLKREEQLANLHKGIAEAQKELHDIRVAKKEVKTGAPPDEEELPKIDMEDPSSKAWDRRIKETVNPVAAELEREKAEVRTFALKEFLADHPALARDSLRVKELMQYYDKIHTATERNKEGVLLDLDKAYAVISHEENREIERRRRVEAAKLDEAFSEVAIDRGATRYASPPEASIRLSEDDKLQLAKWGMTPDEWVKMKQSK